MANIVEIERFLNKAVPITLAEDWDNNGLIVCPDSKKEIKKILIALDTTSGAIEQAKKVGADAILTHHPVMFDGIRKLKDDNSSGKRVIAAIKANIALINYHTCLDAAVGGVNDCIVSLLGGKDAIPFGQLNAGRIFELEEPENYEDFCKRAETALGAPITGINANGKVKKVAVLGGSGKSFLGDVLACGADTFLSGELNYSTQLDAREMNLNTVCATHYLTEATVLPYLAELVGKGFPEIETEIYRDDLKF